MIEKNSKYKKLINNSLIFTVGNFGTKFISFLMVPLYTTILSAEQYGVIDIVLTTMYVLVPILTLELGQGALRFAIDSRTEVEKDGIFWNISVYGLILSTVIIFLTPFLLKIDFLSKYGICFSILLILMLFNNLYSQYSRGIGLVKQYAFNGILLTLVTVVSNIILLIFFDMEIYGYFISMIIAYFISNLYLFFVSQGPRRMRKKGNSRRLLNNMLTYSVPLIPNTTIWWIIDGSTRYFILFFVGATGNGLYAIANKLPSIISMFTSIFSQAWQLSSFEEYSSNDKNAFYTKVFNVYSVLLFLGGSAILVILKPLMTIAVEPSYYESWQMVPMLLIAIIYQSFSGFLGTNYTAAKQTKGAFYTSVYGGIFSVVANLIFIPLLGVVGAGVGAALSFICMFVIRLIDTNKYVEINIEWLPFLLNNMVFLTQAALLFIFDSWYLLIIELGLFCFTIIINKRDIHGINIIIWNKINKMIKKS